jgi:PhnB protein
MAKKPVRHPKRKMAKSKMKKTQPARKKKMSKASTKAKKKVLALPKGYHNITPYFIVNGAAKAIAFYTKVFGAKEIMKMAQPNGKVRHAELKIGDAKIMLSDECPEMNARSPESYGGCPMSIYLYVKNVDDTFARAVAAGATVIRPVSDQFYGDRIGAIQDPYGYQWCLATHVEDVSPATMRKRAAAAMEKNKTESSVETEVMM